MAYFYNPPAPKLKLPTSADELAALLFNAGCLWESACDARDNENAPGHEGAKAYLGGAGACESRGFITSLASEVEAAWNSLSDDARDGWACPFDWEFCPWWLARRMGWEEGDPCADPHATEEEAAQ